MAPRRSRSTSEDFDDDADSADLALTTTATWTCAGAWSGEEESWSLSSSSFSSSSSYLSRGGSSSCIASSKTPTETKKFDPTMLPPMPQDDSLPPPPPSSLTDHLDPSSSSLATSTFDFIGKRARSMLRRIEEGDEQGEAGSTTSSSPRPGVFDAARHSISSILDSVVAMKEEEEDCVQFSLDRLRIVNQLDAIEAACSHPNRREYDCRIRSVVASSSYPRKASSASAMVSVSPWSSVRRPLFDVVVGGPATTRNESASTVADVNVEVRTVVEVSSSSSIISSASSSSSTGASAMTGGGGCACPVRIDRCNAIRPRRCGENGSGGDVSLVVAVGPMSSRGVDGDDDECGTVGCVRANIKEARMVQVNAAPPRYLSSVDLFTTHTASKGTGNGEVKISLRFPMGRGIQGAPPKLRIDLVVEPHG